MAGIACVVVPPSYEASIYGCSAVKITARKVHLLDAAGCVQRSRFYSHIHQIDSKSFADLVKFVDEGKTNGL